MFYKRPVLHGRLDKHGKLVKKGKQVVLYEIYDGFGIPLSVLRIVKSIEIHYKGTVYNAPASAFEEHGITEKYMDERQKILPRKYWHKDNQGVLL